LGYHLYSLADFDVRRLGKHETYIFHFSLSKGHIKSPSLSAEQADSDDISRRFSEAIGSASISITTAVNQLDGMILVEAPGWLNPHTIWYSELLVFCSSKAAAKEFAKRVKNLSSEKALRDFYLGAIDMTNSPSRVEGIFVVAVPNGKGASSVFNHLAKMTKVGVTSEFLRAADVNGFSEALSNASMIKTFAFNNTVVVDVHGNAVLRETVSDLDQRFDRLDTSLNRIEEAIMYQRSDMLPTAEELEIGWGEVDSIRLVPSIYQAKRRLGEEALCELNAIRKELSSLPKSIEVQDLLHEMSTVRRQMDAITKDKKPMTFEASLGFAVFGNGVRAVYKKDVQVAPVNRFFKLVKKLVLIDRLSGKGQLEVARKEEIRKPSAQPDKKID
jgi:hypothetical protein